MTAGLAMPQQSITLSLADPFTVPDYTDITPLVKKWHSKRGRQHELKLFEAGTVDVTLNNQDGRFSPWNTGGPYYNLLSADDGSQDASNGTWGSASNCALGAWGARTPVVIDGPYALQITGNGSTPSTIRTSNTAYAVTVGKSYLAMASFLTSVTARAWTVGIAWYTSGGALISTSTSSSVNDNTTSYTKASVIATAPATAAFAAIIVTGTSLANNEVHWVNRAALFNAVAAVPNTAWAPGQRGLVPTRTLKCTATWASTTYPRWIMYVNSWTPTYYGNVKSEQTISCTDGLGLAALAQLDQATYKNLVASDGAVDYWPASDPAGSSGIADTILGVQASFKYSPTAPTLGTTGPLVISDDTSVTFPAVTGAQYAYAQASLVSSSLSATATAFTVECWFQQTGLPSATENLWTFAAPAYNLLINSLEIQAVGQSGSPLKTTTGSGYCDGNWHHVVCVFPSANSATAIMYIDGASVATSNNSLPVGLPTSTSGFAFGDANSAPSTPGASGSTNPALNMAHVAIYPYALTAAQVLNHYNTGTTGEFVQPSGTRIAAVLSSIGVPTSLQNIAIGISSLQAATGSIAGTAALSYIQTAQNTEQGAFYCDESGLFTFRDRHYTVTATACKTSNATLANDNVGGHFHYLADSLVPAEDDLDLWNDAPVQRTGGLLQRAQNIASQKQYRQRTLTGYTGMLQTSDNEALAMSQWMLSHYQNPYTRVRSVALDNTSGAGANFPQMLGRILLDRITMSWQPLDGTAIPFSQDSLIESIDEVVTQTTWVTTWGLSPAEAQTNFLILNDAVYGKLDSGNRLAF